MAYPTKMIGANLKRHLPHEKGVVRSGGPYPLLFDLVATISGFAAMARAQDNGTANREESLAAPARSAAKRSKQVFDSRKPQNINHIPDASAGVHIICHGACELT